jgi:acetyl-CoA carboxylase biotin carboxyl carrier protein
MDLKRIREVADAFEASDWDEIDLEIDGVRIRLSTDATPASPAPAPLAPSAPAPTPNEGAVRATTLPEGAARSEPEGDGGPADGAAEAPVGADGTPVTAPSPGIFWRAPSPGEPPFVEVGDRVEPGTVVCIVELMKLMNRVVAGVSGTVTAVLVDNGQSVDKGGSLVLVEQD